MEDRNAANNQIIENAAGKLGQQPRNSGKRAGIMAITAVTISWGLDYVFIEYATRFVSPPLFSFIRIAVCVAVMIPLLLIRNSRHDGDTDRSDDSADGGRPARIAKGDLPRVFILGALGSALYNTAESLGTDMTSAAYACLIMAFTPIIGMIFDMIFFGNRLTKSKFSLAALSLAGIWLIVSGSPLGINIKGTAIILAAAVFWTSYIAVLKPIESKYGLTTLLTYIFTAGLICQTPITLILGIGKHDLSPGLFLMIAASSILFIVIANYGYTFAVGRLSVSMTAMFENLPPVTSIIFSFILFGTILSPVQLVGGAIVILATTLLALRE